MKNRPETYSTHVQESKMWREKTMLEDSWS